MNRVHGKERAISNYFICQYSEKINFNIINKLNTKRQSDKYKSLPDEILQNLPHIAHVRGVYFYN